MNGYWQSPAWAGEEPRTYGGGGGSMVVEVVQPRRRKRTASATETEG